LYEKGSIITGTIDALTNFGAFLILEDGSKGMVHISEVKRGFLKNINDALKVGDKVEVKVLQFNSDKKKYDLSIKQATKEMEKVEKQSGPPEFEQKMSLFLKDSEKRQVDIRRNMKNKQKIRSKTW